MVLSKKNINDLFHCIAAEVQAEWGMSGLADTMYEEFARECAARYIEQTGDANE